jgi:exopolysaccharide production protein ExoQ
MPPSLALIVWLVLLLGLLRFDPSKDPRTPLALWVPLIWMFIIGSRLPSQWLGGGMQTASQGLEEGSALDRTIFLILILLAMGILALRSFNWGAFFARNFVLMTFLLFALMSVLWSDFPFVSFKRWFRDFGNYLVILVVLSDPHPLEAVRTLFRRLGYLLVPLSILLIKYYPQIGKSYEVWSGAPMFVGVTTSKNMLGVACLVSGIFFFWDTVSRWPERKERRTRRIIILNLAFLGMTAWLLHLSNSATSRLCLMLGCLVMAAAHTRAVKRHPAFLKILIPMCLCVYMVLEFGFDINARIAGMVGRDPTLTGRTDLWKYLLRMHTNPLLGTGYESFWLGSRLDFVWQRFWLFNEAHNGYLEVYLNLGLVGLCLLGMFLIASYRRIWRLTVSSFALASLSLGVWAVAFFYNMTEAGFRGGLLWMTLLVGVLAVPERTEDRLTNASENKVAGTLWHSSRSDRLRSQELAR